MFLILNDFVKFGVYESVVAVFCLFVLFCVYVCVRLSNFDQILEDQSRLRTVLQSLLD